MAELDATSLKFELNQFPAQDSAALTFSLGAVPTTNTQVTASTLYFNLSVVNTHASNALPFALGSNDYSGGGTTVKRRMSGVASCYLGASSNIKGAAQFGTATNNKEKRALLTLSPTSARLFVGTCFDVATERFAYLASCANAATSAMDNHFGTDNYAITSLIEPLANKKNGSISLAYRLGRCTLAAFTKTAHSERDTPQSYGISVPFSGCQIVSDGRGLALARCFAEQYQKAVPVPEQWFDIPIDDGGGSEIPPVCPLPPASSALFFKLNRNQASLDARYLPFALQCWDYTQPAHVIPIKGAYILENIITCTIDGISVEILQASVRTEMTSAYWQGSITISPNDFDKVNTDADIGSEPLIRLVINGIAWEFICEDVRDNRAFVANSYTLTGRSQTAYLSGDYAKQKTGLITSDLNARQIADQVLNLSTYSIGTWGCADWLVNANNYSLTGKTALGVIADIAQAAGGFVYSDKTGKVLNTAPRWKSAAWDVANADADVTVPASVIASISGEQQQNDRANAVYLSGSVGAKVYRSAEAQDKLASTMQHALYTDTTPMQAAGIAALSETGRHKTESVQLPFSPDKYDIPLAGIGEIWHINEGDGWQGIVNSVSVAVTTENDAPTVWQTVEIDRYLDV